MTMSSADEPNELGLFLRACRDRTRPESVGLARTARRKVSGLRREEVATLSGVSVDYLTRLEQGRERHPSLQTINALARHFRLSRDERLHLARLAGVVPAVPFEERQHDPSSGLTDLVHSWAHTPAVVFNAAYDPIAQNTLGAALFQPFGTANLALSVFLDPAARDFYPKWDTVARNTAGALRHSSGIAPGDARLASVIQTLMRASSDFRVIWADHTVTAKTIAAKSFRHPVVGRVDLTMQAFEVRDAPGQELVVYHAEPGSTSLDALRMLEMVTDTPAANR